MQTQYQPKAVMTTCQFAAATGHTPKTIRMYHFRKGEAFGIRPRKVGRLLLWPADEVRELLEGADRATVA